MAVDTKKLPARALVDTGLVMRAMGDLPADADTPICREFWNAMLAGERELLIAAPTVAEIMRKDGKRDVPRTLSIEVVAFDDVAAAIVGKRFPVDVLKHLNIGSSSLTHLKYDALIVGCAIRHRAECIVALDGDIHKLAAAVELPAFYPGHYQLPAAESATK